MGSAESPISGRIKSFKPSNYNKKIRVSQNFIVLQKLTGLNLSRSKRSLNDVGGGNFLELGIYRVSFKNKKLHIVNTPPRIVKM